MQYNLRFDKLCQKLALGLLAEPPTSLTGGHLHRVYAVQTDRGRYAVKALNPQVMSRPPALPAIIESEHVALIAARHVPAAPARVFDGSAVQALEGQYYLVYDWVDGQTLCYGEITPVHCAKMGDTLAVLHKIDFGALCHADNPSDKPAVDWRTYLRLGDEADAAWAAQLREHMSRLESWSLQMEKAAGRLTSDTVVSHCDLEPKNVMWRGGAPVVIDWEAAGRIHPAQDMVETAVYWSKNESGDIDSEKFKAFVGAYQHVSGCVEADWSAVLSMGFSNLSGWLEYSLKRSLMLECCDAEEQRMGTDHVFATINAAQRYFDAVPQLLQWLEGL